MTRYIAPLVALLSLVFALRAHLKMKELDVKLRVVTFVHREWDRQNPRSERKWNSPSVPREVSESRDLENTWREQSKDYWDTRNWLLVIGLISLTLCF
jgi:hypothetical protein